MLQTITIIKPDDFHVHFRDDEILKAVVPETSRNFNRAIVMPNLVPPILSGKDALEYKKRIQAAIPLKDSFTPLMRTNLIPHPYPLLKIVDTNLWRFANGTTHLYYACQMHQLLRFHIVKTVWIRLQPLIWKPAQHFAR